MGRNLSVTTFFKKAISEEGGIPGFEEFAGNILTSSELSESWARCRAAMVWFVADEAYNTNM